LQFFVDGVTGHGLPVQFRQLAQPDIVRRAVGPIQAGRITEKALAKPFPGDCRQGCFESLRIEGSHPSDGIAVKGPGTAVREGKEAVIFFVGEFIREERAVISAGVRDKENQDAYEKVSFLLPEGAREKDGEGEHKKGCDEFKDGFDKSGQHKREAE